MLKIKYKRSIFHFTETYSDGYPPQVGDTDVHLNSFLITDPLVDQVDNKERFTFHKLFRTLVINLEKDDEEIFDEIGKSTRYKIKRAEREGVEYSEINNPSDKEIQTFTETFNQFAKKKKIQPCNPKKLKACRDKNAFIITMAKVEEDILCFHGYTFDGQRAIMLYSASFRDSHDAAQKNLIGRANRFLHWQSILSFKAKGGKWYDFCGLSLNENGHQGINKFKKGFGGIEADELKTYRGKNLVGKLIILALRWKWRKQPEFIRAQRLLNSCRGGEGLGGGSS
ncbi:peptidoglycan bridge formation glycyltransferase FemA/FemB family protein [Bacillus sp. SG-1]|uniref:peptidoglycan bridge formation glycyltransferase FemA/FemB family protein n=1 Tax=Bacillus sp. SG-1 TaxID=161544 RepID=UPI000154356E|nr:peptidoglycan bridge formation glycyltransferase FemA/FemB family protein [Bacillus sp. SG-1]EDL65261.1 hypothetical protein BSG1_11806 [Bacillus sp. SG-1]